MRHPLIWLGGLAWLAACAERPGEPSRPPGPDGPVAPSADAGAERDAPDTEADATPDAAITADAEIFPRSDAGTPPLPPSCLDVPVVPARRLSPPQYRETVRALLHLPDADPALAPDEAPAITLLGAERLALAARELALASEPRALLPCDPDEVGEAACGLAFIEAFADQAFRRPPTGEERAWLVAAFEALPPEADFERRVRLLVEVVLQSPAFLYRFEVGVGDAPVRPLTDHELATRLAYGLTGAPPDATLRGLADAGLLAQPAEIARETERLLADPRARDRVAGFLAAWLELDRLDTVHPSPDAFPAFTPTLRAAIRSETEHLLRRAATGTLDDLLVTPAAFVDAELAGFYGVEAPPAPQWVGLDPRERAGVLTRAAFLTLRSGPEVQSPVHRGTFIRRHLLCRPMPPPPPTVVGVPITRGGTGDDGHPRTVREIVAARTAAPDCAGCHALINPIGFTLENYNAIGQFQVEEHGYDRHRREPYTVPVDATGAVPDSDIDGPLEGGVALSRALAASDQVAGCLADQWFVWFFERPIQDEDACSVDLLREAFRARRHFADLVRATTTLPAFRLVRGAP